MIGPEFVTKWLLAALCAISIILAVVEPMVAREFNLEKGLVAGAFLLAQGLGIRGSLLDDRFELYTYAVIQALNLVATHVLQFDFFAIKTMAFVLIQLALINSAFIRRNQPATLP